MAGQSFVRCGQLDPPQAREATVAGLTLRVDGRVLTILTPGAIRIAAFAGPVGSTFTDADIARLKGSRAQLALFMGGLGDTEALARANLAQLATVRLPTLFIAGGDDRASVIEAAFDALDPSARDYMIHASGLRELRIGTLRFAVVAGAALGRYARDGQACGFTAEDLTEIAQAVAAGGADRPWLLSWHAPSGRGVSSSFGSTEVGSPVLAAALDVAGSVSAFPEVEAGRPMSSQAAIVVPRLSPTGTLRVDGSRVGAGLTVLALRPEGLVQVP